ncbi:hypothetical protein ACFFRR_000881 [Megaselia abdita]
MTDNWSLDSILTDIGQFGNYQIKNYMLLSIPMTFNAIFSLTYIFTAGSVKYRCNITECDSLTTQYHEPWINFTIPADSQCSKYPSYDLNSCTSQNFDSEASEKCSDFKIADKEYTISQEFNIFCKDEWKLSFVGTINNIGQFIGIPIGGYISDKYGRRIALAFGGVFSAIMGIIRSFSVSYEMFLVFEFLDAATSSTLYASVFILGIELVGPKKRVIACCFLTIFYAVGEILLGIAAMYITNWRVLLRVLYIPALIHIFYTCVLEESVRWLLSQQKNEEAASTLEKAARMNKKPLNRNVIDKLIKSNDDKLNCNAEEKFPITKALRKFSWRIINCSLCWFTNVLVYYGLSLNSVLLSGDKYINFILISAVEIPGFFLPVLIMDRYGRRYSLFACMLVSGITIAVTIFLDESRTILNLIFFLVGKFSITSSFQILYFYTAEIFPTNVRHTLLSFCSMFGRFGSMIAPMTPYLAKYFPSAPSILFSSCAVISGILSLTIPETTETILPSTIDEAENLTNKSEDTYTANDERIEVA